MNPRVNPRARSMRVSIGHYSRCLLPFACLLAAGGAVSAGGAAAPAAPAAPQLVLLHGRILTLDANDSIAEALAIRDGKIAAVGTDRDILKLVRASTRRLDLNGRTATPGLIDSHAHIAEGGVEALYHVDLSDASTVSEVVHRVSEALTRLKPGEWLQGYGWDQGKLAERRYLFAADLDAVSPDNPLWLMHTSGHYGVANSVALRMAHISSHTPDPAAGTIDRDAHGEPTGILEEAAMDAVSGLIPRTTPQQWRAGILHSIELMHREGMTAVKDPDIDRAIWDAYVELLHRGLLKAHVCVLWHAGTTLDSARAALDEVQAQPRPPGSLGDGRLVSCGVKIYMDGSGGARTAWVYQDWNKNSTDVDRGNTGYPTVDPETYRRMVRLFHDARVHVGTHAIGDRAIDWVVDSYAQVLAATPTSGLRHSIIHANIPSAHALETMVLLEQKFDAGYPEVQAPFMWWIGDTYAGNFGPERSLRLVPLESFLRKGIRWGGGSDYPVTPLPARFGLWASIERETTHGAHPFGTAESVDIHAALRSYTIWAARQLFLENRIGSLEVGKDADIAVWDRNMYEIPARELSKLHCEITIMKGDVVYEAQKGKAP
ncbi:MAG TPA: amidohydrolase [Steroidobacteraceae bacterium]|nr:amidohydrolase [Steroidobacteraceae bacterium]